MCLRRRDFSIVTRNGEMKEGLFGQIALFVLEVLPYLHSHQVFPGWRIRSALYGDKCGVVVPGALELAYDPPEAPSYEINLLRLMGVHDSVLGNDWEYLNSLWASYFRVPPRVIAQADSMGNLGTSLGLHYRGTDKNASITHPVSQDDMLTLANDWLKRHSSIGSIFVATDEPLFVDRVRCAFPERTVVNGGPVECHKQTASTQEKADRAVLDCVLLSRCCCVLKCSSALSGFAKVLNPDLEIYRVAACELYSDVPYFPDAYIPKLESDDPGCSTILDRTLQNDWTENASAVAKYDRPFRYMPRYGPLTRLRRRLQFQLHGQWFHTNTRSHHDLSPRNKSRSLC